MYLQGIFYKYSFVSTKIIIIIIIIIHKSSIFYDLLSRNGKKKHKSSLFVR
jgi:hypothetical protein